MTNLVLETLFNRRSIRAFEDRPLKAETRELILKATLRAPTAGNMMLYSILEISDLQLKMELARSCDNQPFIAKAPMVWIFLADWQRWFDAFIHAGAREFSKSLEKEFRLPGEGDMLLACSDALIAAQQSVIAAESLGVGSCYIGDIIENFEFHQKLLDLPLYTVPICMLVYGYPTPQQKARPLTSRFDPQFVLHTNRYQRLSANQLDEMFLDKDKMIGPAYITKGIDRYALAMYMRKFDSEFSREMTRSAKLIINQWKTN